MSDTLVVPTTFKRSIKMICWTIFGEWEREGAQTGSLGLEIRPSKQEVSTPVANKSVITLDGRGTSMLAEEIMLVGTWEIWMRKARPIWDQKKWLKKWLNLINHQQGMKENHFYQILSSISIGREENWIGLVGGSIIGTLDSITMESGVTTSGPSLGGVFSVPRAKFS